MGFLKEHRKELLIAIPVVAIFVLLLYLETQITFFTKFLPVGDNKLIIMTLNINILLILLVLFLVARILIKNYIEKKRGIWGSGLKTKLTFTLLFISIVPSFTLFMLTTGFYYKSIDYWFGQKIEDTINEAIDLSQFYYTETFQRYEHVGKVIADGLRTRKILNDKKLQTSYLNRSLATHTISHISLFDTGGNPVTVVGYFDRKSFQEIMGKTKLVRPNQPVHTIVPLDTGELIAVGMKITDENNILWGTLFVGSATTIRASQKIQSVAFAYRDFKESRPFRKILRHSMIIPLSLVTIMTIFFSVWVGYKMATEITIPIEKVKEGASIIATGKFDINLEDRGKDEIGTLVQAFNSMARELKIAKDEIEEKRRYMEVILNNVATGIISTDKTGNVLLMNPSAEGILNIKEGDWAGKTLKEVFGEDFRKHLRPFLKDIRESSDDSTVRDLHIRVNKDITNMRVSLTTLKDPEGKTEGFIIAFDDITYLVKAEKLAAWREVARKLTHEIKNPLTPILLSAERIRRRLLGKFESTEKEILDETTSVIIRSVEDIKRIVNELTRFGRGTQGKSFDDINTICEETIDLYHNLYQNISFRFSKNLVPRCRVDRESMKRVMTNLISNSLKAIGSEQGEILIETGYDDGRGIATIVVADTGKGIPDSDKERVFDPYFTTDENGTGLGLGLAIVHSIILEHQGRIFVRDNTPKGSRFIIELPVAGEEA